MLKDTDLNILISNVVSENRFKHCRLCLKEIQDNFHRLDDRLADVEMNLEPVGNWLASFMGKELCEEIPGVDAVCPECMEMAKKFIIFIEDCRKSTYLLRKIFDNLSVALDIDIEAVSNHQKMYVIVGEEESKIVLVNRQEVKEEVIYYCDSCKLEFHSDQELIAHNESEHSELLSCEICSESFDNVEELKAHCSNNHIYKCNVCNLMRSTEEKVKKHFDKHHKEYVCVECGKPCIGFRNLRFHEQKHGTKSFCPKCGKSYLTKGFFEKHVKLCLEDKLDRHPYRAQNDKSYFCEKCGKGYGTRGGLRVHNRFEHGNAKHHTCEFCGKKFTAPSYLKAHMVSHTGEKKFTCFRCSKNFVSKEALLYHTRRHTGEKPYSCNLCTEKFVNASARAEHIKFKHTGPTLTCEICKRKFFTSSFLKQHMSRHSDPSSKLYAGRNMIPPDMPGEQNMRTKIEK